MRIAGRGIRPHPGFLDATLVSLPVSGASGFITRQGLVPSHVRNGLLERLVTNNEANGSGADFRLPIIDVAPLDAAALAAAQLVGAKLEHIVTIFAKE